MLVQDVSSGRPRVSVASVRQIEKAKLLELSAGPQTRSFLPKEQANYCVVLAPRKATPYGCSACATQPCTPLRAPPFQKPPSGKNGFGGLCVVFSLSGPVAFAGSRSGSPFPVSSVVAAVLAAGGVVRVGCAHGVDQAVRSAAGASAVVVSASAWSHLPPRVALAVRTRAVVSGAAALVVFSPAVVPALAGGLVALHSGVLGPGSALVLSVALELGLPVWVAGSARPVGSGWASCAVADVAGFVRFSAQPAFASAAPALPPSAKAMLPR